MNIGTSQYFNLSSLMKKSFVTQHNFNIIKIHNHDRFIIRNVGENSGNVTKLRASFISLLWPKNRNSNFENHFVI